MQRIRNIAYSKHVPGVKSIPTNGARNSIVHATNTLVSAQPAAVVLPGDVQPSSPTHPPPTVVPQPLQVSTANCIHTTDTVLEKPSDTANKYGTLQRLFSRKPVALTPPPVPPTQLPYQNYIEPGCATSPSCSAQRTASTTASTHAYQQPSLQHLVLNTTAVNDCVLHTSTKTLDNYPEFNNPSNATTSIRSLNTDVQQVSSLGSLQNPESTTLSVKTMLLHPTNTVSAYLPATCDQQVSQSHHALHCGNLTPKDWSNDDSGNNLSSIIPNFQRLQMRVGIHCGDVVGGVVGKKVPRYHLFGDTVTIANYLESHGRPNRVQLSEQAVVSLCSPQTFEYDSLQYLSELQLEYRGRFYPPSMEVPLYQYWIFRKDSIPVFDEEDLEDER
uniref:Guanylate cyclase soluble subunit beta-2 n=2 Tax=Lygus hesperus TaxID=30085 RepID=A0A146KJY5_LYGHE